MTIPDSVTSIRESAFEDCSSLTIVTILNIDCDICNYERTLGDPSITTIYGYAGSTTEQYAYRYGYPFKQTEKLNLMFALANQFLADKHGLPHRLRSLKMGE